MLFVLENAPLLGGCLLALAVIVWVVGARRGSLAVVAVAPACVVVVLALAIAAWLVELPSDHALRTVRALVAAAEQANIPALRSTLANDATIHMGSFDGHGSDRARIDRAFESFRGRHKIEDNSVWSIEGRTLASDRAMVDLTCRTRTASSLGTVPTQWTFEVVRDPDGNWRIARIAWRAVAGQTPSLSLF